MEVQKSSISDAGEQTGKHPRAQLDGVLVSFNSDKEPCSNIETLFNDVIQLDNYGLSKGFISSEIT